MLKQKIKNISDDSNFLDLSFTSANDSLIYLRIQSLKSLNMINRLRYLSVAHNNLINVPESGLNLVNDTLEYLTLTGNLFYGVRSKLDGWLVK